MVAALSRIKAAESLQETATRGGRTGRAGGNDDSVCGAYLAVRGERGVWGHQSFTARVRKRVRSVFFGEGKLGCLLGLVGLLGWVESGFCFFLPETFSFSISKFCFEIQTNKQYSNPIQTTTKLCNEFLVLFSNINQIPN